MQQQTLTALLAAITGNLYATNDEEEQQLDRLHDQLAKTLQHQDAASVTNQSFSFQSSDFFFTKNIKGSRLDKIDERVKKILEGNETSDLKVFVRDTPIRSTQVAGSIPNWAVGAKVINTIGPFIGRDGRWQWFDFFKLEKLVALYFPGQAQPAILFKALFTSKLFTVANPELTRVYNLVPGSVWINAKILSAAAPADRYCGIRVTGGTIQLDTLPQLSHGRLFIDAVNNVQVQLKMEQPVAAAVNAADEHGADARALKIKLPATWQISFSAITRVIRQLDSVQWTIYGQEGKSEWKGDQSLLYDPVTSRVLVPLVSEPPMFAVQQCLSPFTTFSNSAPIKNTWWGIPAAIIDVNNTLEADGNGALLMLLKKGLTASKQGSTGADTILINPLLIAQPGRIGLTDLTSNASGSTQHIDLWRDEMNPHGTSVEITYQKNAAFIYNSLAKGDEVLFTSCDTALLTDRPVKVNGEPLAVNTKKSVIIFAANAKNKIALLYDDNIIFDNTNPNAALAAANIKPISLALENALFTTTPVNGCLLYMDCTHDWKKAMYSKLFLTVGLYAYLPTLPDPYAANISLLQRQYATRTGAVAVTNQRIWLWLVCRVSSKPAPAADNVEIFDAVKTSFHFGNLPFDDDQAPAGANTNKAILNAGNLRSTAGATMLSPTNIRAAMFNVPQGESGAEEIKTLMMADVTGHRVNMEQVWDERVGRHLTDSFSLLDVSSNANQMGVSFGLFGGGRMAMLPTATVGTAVTDTTVNNALPFMVKDMQVLAPGNNVRAFTLPQIAWEPVFNLAKKVDPMDPDPLFNYYPNDGGPMRMFNVSATPVPLAPIPVVAHLIAEFKNAPKSSTIAAFTLPFGMRALAGFSLTGEETLKPSLTRNQPDFNKYKGGIQFSIRAGNYGKNFSAEPALDDSPMLPGYTFQLNNILNMDGTPDFTSNLADQPTVIFNKEFFNFSKQRGVPVSRMDISGYGANMFSNWLSPSAAFAATSQARFDVMLGRTAHEVVQVKSILYPWGIRVVRTITLQRESSGYVYRQDSGWQAESDGLFDFRYRLDEVQPLKKPYTIHPGVVRGLFNIRNITIDPTITPFKPGVAECRAVFFDADVEIENVVQGKITATDKMGNKHTNCVVSKRVLGYVQLAPRDKPIEDFEFVALLNEQRGSIGGSIDCQVDINQSNQNMRINRFDVSPSVDEANKIIFVVAARGNVILPKDGSWSMVQHNAGSGEVTPLSEGLTVPLVRVGEWIEGRVIDEVAAKGKLLRIANPMDLLRNVVPQTINFGLLQNMGTQKALFLTPSFKFNEKTLLSKTPPIFADAYRMMTGKGIFPNIGDAVTNFGKAFSLLQGVDGAGNAIAKAFDTDALKDGAINVFKLLKIDAVKQGEAAVEQGMQLMKSAAAGAIDKALKFDLPDFDVPLVEMDGLKIYIEYKTSKIDKADPKKDLPGTKNESKLNFDIASKIGAAATDAAETWKGRLNNMSMVVDLGTFERLMRIKGNFDSKKGKASSYGGDADGIGEGLPTPEIEFHPALQPIIDLLQVLADLSSGDYGAALKKGLKIAMGNAGEIWEYKFEATKEIPLVRFPPTKALYDNPQTPLKLEASMGLGVYFNAALKVTTDAKQLLPTAGAFLKFYGGISVMCVSVGAGTIYAIGSVDVKIACDTAKGPNLTLKFGFGASIMVGLPVVGNVSIMFMVGVEMYADSKEISITAFMLFRGHAELLGGLVGVTITIEAKGTIRRIGGRTDCSAQVTFAIDISIFLIIDISFSETWGEQRQVA